jgi:hypothetical protein
MIPLCEYAKKNRPSFFKEQRCGLSALAALLPAHK